MHGESIILNDEDENSKVQVSGLRSQVLGKPQMS
jgi:hypothetical protein